MGLETVTKFIAVPGAGGVFQQSFLTQLVSIHFPAGKLVRVSFTGSGSNSVAKASISFPFGTFTEPVLNLIRSSTGQEPAITDPPSKAMIENLYAWSIINDQGNFVYYNTSRVASRFGKYTPVVIHSPAFSGLKAFTTPHVIVWYYASNLSPSGPFDPIVMTTGGGFLALFDPTAPSLYSAGQILDFINSVAEGEAQAGVGGVPFIPVGDGGDISKGNDLVSALVSGSKLPALGPSNTYVATTLDTHAQEEDAGWGLQGSLFDTKDGVFVPHPLATISDFKFALNVPAVTITINVDDVKNTMTESKN